MKKSRLLYNSDNPPNEKKPESSAQASQSKSPYLRAILSGTAKFFTPEKGSPINPDHAAALRYIKESAFVKKFYIEKMSC